MGKVLSWVGGAVIFTGFVGLSMTSLFWVNRKWGPLPGGWPRTN